MKENPQEPYDDVDAFTPSEAKKLRERIDKYFLRLRRELGDRQLALYSVSGTAILVENGQHEISITGNIAISTLLMSVLLAAVVRETSKEVHKPQGVVLLEVIAELAEDVRRLWGSDGQGVSIPITQD